jgi:hypothetical protein
MTTLINKHSTKSLFITILLILVIIFFFIFISLKFVNQRNKLTADNNAKECYQIVTTIHSDKDYGYDDDIYQGCIILASNGNYFIDKKYGGTKDIETVYWFFNNDNWKVSNGKLINFEEVINKEKIYGIYEVN